MAWPNAPANGQIFTRADGVQFQFRSATQSWLRLTTEVTVTQTLVTAVGVSAVPIPSGAKKVRVKGVGAGGSGSFAGGNNRGAGGPGGGSGWAGEALIDLTGVSAISANIGAGGVGTTTTVENGGSTVLTFTGIGTITFGGGAALGLNIPASPTNGTYEVRGAVGGAGSTTIPGQVLLGASENGDKGMFNAGITNAQGASGAGGNSPFGRGGRSRGSLTGQAPPDSNTGEDGQGYGSGGGGACSSASSGGGSAAAKGGNGANGMALFEWIF